MRSFWLFNPCRCYRQQLCLLAANVLPDAEKDQIVKHLAACPDCQEYLNEIKSVTTLLDHSKAGFADLQPTPAGNARWNAAIRAADAPKTVEKPARRAALREFRSSRRKEAPSEVRAIKFEPPHVGSYGSWFPRAASWVVGAFHDWYLDVIRPHRRVWTSFATIWILIFMGHLSLRDHSQIVVAKASSRLQQQMVMAIKDRQTILAELLADHSSTHDADRPRLFQPKPRTKRTDILAA